jgi:hypothetical protein
LLGEAQPRFDGGCWLHSAEIRIYLKALAGGGRERAGRWPAQVIIWPPSMPVVFDGNMYAFLFNLFGMEPSTAAGLSARSP